MQDKLEMIGKRERNLAREIAIVLLLSVVVLIVLAGWGV